MPPNTRQLNVSITPHFSKFIRTKIKSGRYANASEVVREALRRLEQDEAVREQAVIVDPDNAEQEILKGLNSIDRGQLIELKDHEELQAFFADIIARGKKSFAAKKTAARR
jgi:antitoxin ParD1/3/4